MNKTRKIHLPDSASQVVHVNTLDALDKELPNRDRSEDYSVFIVLVLRDSGTVAMSELFDEVTLRTFLYGIGGRPEDTVLSVVEYRRTPINPGWNGAHGIWGVNPY